MLRGKISRRKLLKSAGAAGAGMLLPRSGVGEVMQSASESTVPDGSEVHNGRILPLTSTSEVLIPSRGRMFTKFSFDFPEPSVEFEGLRFGFRVNTYENVYGLDLKKITVQEKGGALEIHCPQLIWAGGQETAPGHLAARLRKNGPYVEWHVQVDMRQPIKSIATVVRGVPRGRLSFAGQIFWDPKEDEVLVGYPFSAGDLFGANPARGMETPLAVIQSGGSDYFVISCLDDQVRAKRFYFQPGEKTYRVDLIFEEEGWVKANRVVTPMWRVGKASTLEDAVRPHYEHLERTFKLPDWATRQDVPTWFRKISLVVSLHGMGWTGYVFNAFSKMLETLHWVANQIPPENVLVFLPAWDGRYYWNYPLYKAADRLGGESGFRNLIAGGHKLGFRFMPMFGTNAANQHLVMYSKVSNAVARQIDGGQFDIDWVDWDRDGHQEGGISYMNIGVDSWREWLQSRIADTIDRYQVDGYFLDIAGGWMDNPQADMHEGMRQLVKGLRAKYPDVLPCGEMHYDALLSFIPVYQAFVQFAYPPAMQKYVREFMHLSNPAPGRGSSGVHEIGFTRFDPTTLALNDFQIPTITVVDDTFDRYKDVMTQIINIAKKRGNVG